MKYILKSILFLLVAVVALSSCSDEETYADQKKREKSAIESFLSRDVVIQSRDGVVLLNTGRTVGHINEISEEQFYAQNCTTNLDNNEYVKFGSTGIYMQIVSVGPGRKLKDDDELVVDCRFVEYNILGDSLMLSNRISQNSSIYPELMAVSMKYGSISASFTNKNGFMYSAYSTPPQAWIEPLKYINLGYQTDEDPRDRAQVRLIAPHTMGTTLASSYVYPTFYEISYKPERGSMLQE